MKSQRRPYFALAVGFIALFFWYVGLYWSHALWSRVSSLSVYPYISIRDPEGLKVKIPNMKTYSPGMLSCSFEREKFFANRLNALTHLNPWMIRQPVIEFETIPTGNFTWLSFVYDDMEKQFVMQQIEGPQEKQIRKIVGYIGPKGYSAVPNPALGTFGKPQLLSKSINRVNNLVYLYFPFYDSQSRRFYRIEINAQRKQEAKHVYLIPAMDSIEIIAGPVQNQLDWEPVQIDHQLFHLPDPQGNLEIKWSPPSQIVYRFRDGYADQYSGIDPNTMPDSEATSGKGIVLKQSPRMDSLKTDFFVLHKNGRIDYLNANRLTVVCCAGYLPEIGFYENSRSRRPMDMADYEAKAFYDPNGVYIGMAVAAVGRDGFMMGLSFYDTEGRLSRQCFLGDRFQDSNTYYSVPAEMSHSPAGPLFLVARYLLENLQSPLLRLLDMPAAVWVEPENRYNTLFVQPNSFIGLMKVEFGRFGFWIQLSFLMLPSAAVSFWLGIKARQKAGALGYNEFSKDGWLITVLAFGIPAYITFRLTLPKERMVTCANCGNMRRVEFDICQSCKRNWEKTKSLTTAPDWSVRDTAKTAPNNPPPA